jgi:HEAT repeat protein
MIFKKTSIALFVFTLSLAPLWAVTPAQLQQLAGKSVDTIQASQYAEVYQDAFAHLTKQMDQTTGDARYAHQVMLQDICLHASRPGAEQQRLAMSKALASTLQSKTMTPEIRYWVLLQIERTGQAEVLPVLTKSLGSTDKTEQGCARAALEKNSDSQATEILLKALATTQDKAFAAGLISSLGNRQDPKAVEAIGQQLDHTNSIIGAAAVTAMVKINTPDAVTMLQQKLSPTHPVAGDIAKGLLDIAAISAAPKANAIYDDLYVWSDEIKPASSVYSVRKAALIGLAENNSAGIDKMIITDFNAEDPAVQSMAIAAAAVTQSSRPAKAMADHSDQLDNTLNNQLIIMLGNRNESLVMTPIKHAVKSNDSVLLQTVVDTLSQLDTRESAVMLIELTRNSNGQISRYAFQNIVASGNVHIDELLKAEADSGDDKQRAAAIVLLGERKTPNITKQLFKYAQSDNEVIYKAALKAIGSSASADSIPELCGMVKTSTSESFKTSALLAINKILRNSQDQKAAYAIILQEIKAADEDQKVTLMTTLKMCGDAEAMKYCLGLLSDAEGESFDSLIPQTALKMLSFWSDPMPAKHLLDRAKTSQHKLAYAQAAADLAKNMLRYNKEQAKKIAEDVKALNLSETINVSADKIINIR